MSLRTLILAGPPVRTQHYSAGAAFVFAAVYLSN
jgi:hypothetical protein